MYKVLEIFPVDDETLEKTVNEWLDKGYALDRLEFVRQEGVRRPVMAFLFMLKINNQTPTHAEPDPD